MMYRGRIYIAGSSKELERAERMTMEIDNSLRARMADAARGIWNDEALAMPRPLSVNPESDEEIIAWAESQGIDLEEMCT
jgi:hypothetical protein